MAAVPPTGIRRRAGSTSLVPPGPRRAASRITARTRPLADLLAVRLVWRGLASRDPRSHRGATAAGRRRYRSLCEHDESAACREQLAPGAQAGSPLTPAVSAARARGPGPRLSSYSSRGRPHELALALSRPRRPPAPLRQRTMPRSPLRALDLADFTGAPGWPPR